MLSHLTTQDTVVKDFISLIRENGVDENAINNSKMFTRASQQIMAEEYPEIEVDRMDVAPCTLQDSERPTRSRPTLAPLAVAQQYGYITAKMLRVKIFHQFLWQCVYAPEHTVTSPRLRCLSGDPLQAKRTGISHGTRPSK